MKRFGYKVMPFIIPVLFIVGWQFLASSIDNNIKLPTINRVLIILLNPMDNLIGIGSLVKNIFVSLVRVIFGYIISIIFAIPIGILMGHSKTVDRLLSLFLSFFKPIPSLAWVPLVLAWFGIASLATIFNVEVRDSGYLLLNNVKLSMLFIIFMGAFFPILTNTVYGIKSVKKTLIDSALMLGASKKDIYMKILYPGALPSIFTGFRVGLGSAWMCLICAEMLPGSIAGVGYMISHAYQVTRIDVVIAGIISIGLVGGFLDLGFRFIEGRYFKWQRLAR